MYLIKGLGVMKLESHRFTHSFVKIDIFENWLTLSPILGVKEWRWAKIHLEHLERGGAELSEYHIRFSLALIVSSKMSTKVDLFL